MLVKTKQELYQTFLDYIAKDIHKERLLVNRRMLTAFFWCFILPALLSSSILLLIKFGVLPRSLRSHLDWVLLILPVFYSLYILGSEVLSQIPAAFRRGGMANTLGQAAKEGEWRDRVSESLGQVVVANTEEWEWVISSFKMDLQALDYRTKYLTALAGAVFFLLMQGIDSLAEPEEKVTWVKTTLLGWVNTTPNDLTQFVGLALFLVLLYLSGSQNYQALLRYLNCAELIRQKSHSKS